ncbi:cyclin-dependent kinase 2-associated protein 2 [Silurus asotus]|uniref:Cyclin-dependent kinase 2-associated protein 2 n=1 Tax=Silurus asotus TaxID=30991 RepID=A0AAD5AZK0_SILAS|nr:cyclin-dependent kinase 2-associated protein 2 [Silurus asotus]
MTSLHLSLLSARSCGSSPSLPSASTFRPAFSDFGPPSMGFVQPVKVSQGSTYSELLSVIEEMSREIRPTYAGSKSAMERLKRVVRIYQKCSKEGTVVNRRQGHVQPKLIDAREERRLVRVVRSNRRAPVA